MSPRSFLASILSAALAGAPASAQAPSALSQLGEAAQGADVAAVADAAKALEKKLFEVSGEGNEARMTISEAQLGRLYRVSATIAQADGVGLEAADFVDASGGGDWVVYFNKAEGKIEVLQKNLAVRARPGTAEAEMLRRSYSDSLLKQLTIQKSSPTANPPPPPAPADRGGGIVVQPDASRQEPPEEDEDQEEADGADEEGEAAGEPAPAPRVRLEPGPEGAVVSLKDLLVGDAFGVGSALARWAGATYNASESRIVSLRVFRRNLEADVRLSLKATSASHLRPNGTNFFVTVHYSIVELPSPEGFEPRPADQRVGYFLSRHADYSRPELRDERVPTVHNINRWRLEKLDPEARVSRVKDPITYWIDETVPEDLHPILRRGILSWNAAFEAIGFKDAIEVRAVKDLPEAERKGFSVHDISNDVVVSIFSGEAAYAHGPSRSDLVTGEIYSAAIRWSDVFVRALRGEAHEEQTKVLKDRLEAWAAMEADHDPATCDDASHGHARRHAAELERWALASASWLQVLRRQPGFTKKDEKRYFEEALASITTHEAGHTLGLRHNFKASRHAGAGGRLTSSVMDYNLPNVPRRTQDGGFKWRGPFYQVEPGEYDRWAIRYGYIPLEGLTARERSARLAEIADESRDRPELQYGTDEDTGLGDPDAVRFDGPGDPLEYARTRNELVRRMWAKLAREAGDTRAPTPYADLRRDVFSGVALYQDGLQIVGDIVGGMHVGRQTAASEGAAHEDAFTPVPRARQEEALRFLVEEYLDEEKTRLEPALLRRLAHDRRGALDDPYPETWPYDHEATVSGMQQAVVRRLMNPALHRRLERHRQYVDDEADALPLSTVFSRVDKAVWEGVEKRDAEALKLSAGRQDLQSLHVDRLIALRKSGTREGTILARRSLKDIERRIEDALLSRTIDDVTRGHLEELQERIERHFTRPTATTEDLSALQRLGFALAAAIS